MRAAGTSTENDVRGTAVTKLRMRGSSMHDRACEERSCLPRAASLAMFLASISPRHEVASSVRANKIASTYYIRNCFPCTLLLVFVIFTVRQPVRRSIGCFPNAHDPAMGNPPRSEIFFLVCVCVCVFPEVFQYPRLNLFSTPKRSR